MIRYWNAIVPALVTGWVFWKVCGSLSGPWTSLMLAFAFASAVITAPFSGMDMGLRGKILLISTSYLAVAFAFSPLPLLGKEWLVWNSVIAAMCMAIMTANVAHENHDSLHWHTGFFPSLMAWLGGLGLLLHLTGTHSWDSYTVLVVDTLLVGGLAIYHPLNTKRSAG